MRIMSMSPFHFHNCLPIDLTNLCIEGERILLRSLQQRDGPVIFREFNKKITRYMYPKPAATVTETLGYIATARQSMASGNNLLLAVLDKKTEEFLGGCGLHGETQPTTPELGIWIKESAHGHKYGREAIRTLALWALQHLHFDYLVYPVDRANLPSRKIPESLGGSVVAEEQVAAQDGNLLDEVIYHIPRQALERRSGTIAH